MLIEDQITIAERWVKISGVVGADTISGLCADWREHERQLRECRSALSYQTEKSDELQSRIGAFIDDHAALKTQVAELTDERDALEIAVRNLTQAIKSVENDKE